MKAVVYTRYGPPEALRLVDIEKPAPGDDEVLVRVHATSVNAADWRLLMARPFLVRLVNGMVRPRRRVLGSDVAGTVEAVGGNVRRFRPGDAVVGALLAFGCGGFAEYACAREDAWFEKPADIPFDEAAALPMAGLTALQGLRDAAKVQPGQTVLVSGASGGVGSFAVQIAKHLGAEVTAVCSTRKVALARALGADHLIDYSQQDFTTGERRYDVIFAVNGYHPIRHYKRALRPAGRYVMAGGTSAQLFEGLLLGRLVFMTGGKTMAVASGRSSREDVALLMELVRSGKLKPVIDRRYPLSDVPDAIRYMVEGRAGGKVVIVVSPEGQRPA